MVVHGTADVEWLEGERFLINRARTDHPDFPDSISIIGFTDRDRVGDKPDSDLAGSPLTMHYFDSRGVFRLMQASIDGKTWRIWRDSPGFSQRFVGTFSEDGDTIDGLWELCEDDEHWNDDLKITYRRR